MSCGQFFAIAKTLAFVMFSQQEKLMEVSFGNFPLDTIERVVKYRYAHMCYTSILYLL